METQEKRKIPLAILSCGRIFAPPFWEKARVAQLVEQLAFNQLVLGSSPSPRTLIIIKELVFLARKTATPSGQLG